MFVIRKDIFLITLISDVTKWYSKWYNGNFFAMKEVHLDKLLTHYEPERFAECVNLYEERELFLIEVQQIMDTYISTGGIDIWMN